jgi:methylenetetrahydrofolate dehydrogenase (NADP+)/methenyltetrahydrofolate cyclohydrolase
VTTARILSGKEAAAAVEAEVARQVAALAARGKGVGLATVKVGGDPASAVYVAGKHRAADRVGMHSFDHALPADASRLQVLELIGRLNGDPAVDGIVVQMPVPGHLDPFEIVEAIDPAKDADGLHPINLGRLMLGRPGPVPATPGGIVRLLEHYRVETRGAFVVVVGRSFLVGRPLAVLLGLKGRDATVALAHTRTRDLASLTRQADILVAAIGRPKAIGPDYVKPGAVVIDVGINRTGSGLVGDADFAALSEIAGAITPVPGGIGLMTIASLLANTVAAAEAGAA